MQCINIVSVVLRTLYRYFFTSNHVVILKSCISAIENSQTSIAFRLKMQKPQLSKLFLGPVRSRQKSIEQISDVTEVIRYPSGKISNLFLLLQPLGKLNASGLKKFLNSRVLLKGFLPCQHIGRVLSSVASFRGFPLSSRLI